MPNIYKVSNAKFRLGDLYLTTAADKTLAHEDVGAALQRHAHRDWGDVSAEDAEQNARALDEGLRLMSVYSDRHGVKFWIITEADRSSTTVLLPDDY